MAKAATLNPTVPAWAMRLVQHRSLIVPIAVIGLLAVIVVPLPPMVMDVLLAVNIALAAVILLTTIYVETPLEFSVFPSLLLGTTLFRLVLNIATTRMILSADASTLNCSLSCFSRSRRLAAGLALPLFSVVAIHDSKPFLEFGT